MRERVRALLDAGIGHREAAERLGVCKSTVAYHARRLDVPADFGFSADAWNLAVRRGAIVARPVAMPIEELLVVGRPTSRAHLKQRLIKEGLKENRCEECGLTTWRGKPFSMQLHHINGDGRDNRLENLAFLCADCHAQTDTYGGRNGHRRRRAQLKVVPPDQEEDDA
jgi:hypothetical protein